MASTTMTKTQLVRLMAEKLELTNKQAAAFLDGLAEVALAQTKKTGIFILPGLGRLKKVQRKARTGRNPQTGEAIKITGIKTTAKFYLEQSRQGRHHPGEEVVFAGRGLAGLPLAFFISSMAASCVESPA